MQLANPIYDFVLSVFDQNNRQENHHILNVKEEDFPQIYRPIIRSLQYAAETREIHDSMDLEDEVLRDLQNLERKVAKKEIELQEKEQLLQEKEQVIEQKIQELKQKEQELELLRKRLKELGKR